MSHWSAPSLSPYSRLCRESRAYALKKTGNENKTSPIRRWRSTATVPLLSGILPALHNSTEKSISVSSGNPWFSYLNHSPVVVINLDIFGFSYLGGPASRIFSVTHGRRTIYIRDSSEETMHEVMEYLATATDDQVMIDLSPDNRPPATFTVPMSLRSLSNRFTPPDDVVEIINQWQRLSPAKRFMIDCQDWRTMKEVARYFSWCIEAGKNTDPPAGMRFSNLWFLDRRHRLNMKYIDDLIFCIYTSLHGWFRCVNRERIDKGKSPLPRLPRFRYGIMIEVEFLPEESEEGEEGEESEESD
ncbi:hypothetical protein QBC34DRAFT_154907 [Podospora aff. communis PSN243]|uniref:Uncharacterized protein n=1 Tax=Podospora aff. communis PSN243 TaxID=3040156 RepID=A0AAV9H0X0_9PEZI|nr:hypothetical protein QBC34DRAFT_154907 [Podospora aff. communis PSN243]